MIELGMVADSKKGRRAKCRKDIEVEFVTTYLKLHRQALLSHGALDFASRAFS